MKFLRRLSFKKKLRLYILSLIFLLLAAAILGENYRSLGPYFLAFWFIGLYLLFFLLIRCQHCNSTFWKMLQAEGDVGNRFLLGYHMLFFWKNLNQEILYCPICKNDLAVVGENLDVSGQSEN
jgi:hypothetical protein